MADRANERLSILAVQLSGLSPSSLVRFSMNCAEQVFPFLEQWSEQEGNNLASVARDCLEFVQQIATQQVSYGDAINERIRMFGELIPDTEESATLSSSGALDAAFSVLGVMRCVQNPQLKDALFAAKSAIIAYDLTSNDSKLSSFVTVEDFSNQDLASEALKEWERQLKLIETL